MAKIHEGLYPPGTTAKHLGALFNPGDPLKDAAYAATAGKNLADTQKLQANNAADANFRALIQSGNYTPATLMAAASHNPALMAEVPKTILLQVASNPNASAHDRAIAAQAAGLGYGTTEEGTHYVQGQENVRSQIAAGPGYAAANAARYGHDLSYKAAHDRLVQDQQHWTLDPKPLYDPATNTTTFMNQGDLTTMGPTTSVPYSPEAYKGANAPASFSLTPGGVPILGRQSDLTTALMHPEMRTFYAPTPEGVQTQEREPIEATTPGDTTPRLVTKGDIARNPGMYSPVPKAGGVVTPTPQTLPQDSTYDATQALRRRFNQAAGWNTESGGFLLDPNTQQSAYTLPPDIEKMMPDLLTQIQTYASNNHLNWDAAADQVISERFGEIQPTQPGAKGFTITRNYLGPNTFTPGAVKRAPLAVPKTPEGTAIISPYSTTSTAPPAGAPRVPPGSPTTALAPPAPAATGYQPGGAQPYKPPTISLGGNPAPPPTPRLLVQPQPPAPAPTAPAATAAPAPNPDAAALIQHAQDAITAGANPAAVAARLKSQFGIALPPPPAPPPAQAAAQ